MPNVTLEPSNVTKINRTTKCDKNTVICDVGTAPYEIETIKNKGITECDKSTVICDVGTAQ